ncbi:MAG: hypothetical protein J6066_06400 [Lachnospiraceae bacterium]|jgi:hypothetical protein|nr:hypothetical protein [Lachnospiraceae bacterium]
MPTRVEEILKQIHILFAKGETYQNSPDLVILSKTDMFALLQELNEAMYEVLDQYEATTRSKEMARLETEREASEIIAKAKIGAEDVQAGSLAYTDTMLDELSLLLDNTTQYIRSQYLEFMAAMDEKQEGLKTDRLQIQEKLKRFHDSENYLKMLEEIREDRAAEKEDDQSNSDKNEVSKKENSGSQAPAADENEFPPPPKAPEPVIRVNRPGENSGVTFTTRRSHNKKSKTAPPKANRVQAMSEEEYNRLSPEQQEALENSTPAYGQGYTADDFDLDAEYEQFKQENEAANKKDTPKKSGFKLFNKKKK